jgi:hypothetical protein
MLRRTLPSTLIFISIGFITLLFFNNCKQKEEPTEEPIPIKDIGPSRGLQIAVQNLAILGFIPATKSDDETYPYHSHLITIQNQPFFIVDVKQHWFLGRNDKYSEVIEQGTIGKVKNAWAYIVQAEEAAAIIPDAIIEEWQFETQKEAFDAFKEMGDLINSRYIKEPSYSLQHDKRVYLLYTRAHAFQKELDRIYEMLKSHL